MKDALISKLELDSPDDKGVSKRQHLQKVYKQTGITPAELESEVVPEFWDEAIFGTFFEIFQRDKEFYHTLYYYQKIMEVEFDGEDISILHSLWNSANTYLAEKDKKKHSKSPKSGAKPKGKRG